MAYLKGKKVESESGIWVVAGYERKKEKVYLAEVWLRDPKTNQRIKQTKASNRIDVLRDWRYKRKNAQTSGELAKERSRKHITFSQLTDEYLSDWSAKRKESTVKTERNRIEGILKPYFGQMVITGITRKTIEEFIRKRRDGSLDGVVAQGRRNTKKGGVTIATTNRDLCRLKNIFKKAVEWNYLETNPAIGIPQEQESVPDASYLDREEVPRFFAACEQDYLPIFTTAVYTGLRFGELMKLEWRDLDFTFDQVMVRKPKNDETRYVPLNRDAKDVLEAMKSKVDPDERDRVFVNPETGKPYSDVRKAMKRALDNAGIKKSLRFHDLRHTTGSHLGMNGSTEIEIAEYLGHKDTKMAKRYTHLSKTHLKAVANRLNFGEDVKDGVEKLV